MLAVLLFLLVWGAIMLPSLGLLRYLNQEPVRPSDALHLIIGLLPVTIAVWKTIRG